MGGDGDGLTIHRWRFRIASISTRPLFFFFFFLSTSLFFFLFVCVQHAHSRGGPRYGKELTRHGHDARWLHAKRLVGRRADQTGGEARLPICACLVFPRTVSKQPAHSTFCAIWGRRRTNVLLELRQGVRAGGTCPSWMQNQRARHTYPSRITAASPREHDEVAARVESLTCAEGPSLSSSSSMMIICSTVAAHSIPFIQIPLTGQALSSLWIPDEPPSDLLPPWPFFDGCVHEAEIFAWLLVFLKKKKWKGKREENMELLGREHYPGPDVCRMIGRPAPTASRVFEADGSRRCLVLVPSSEY
ncbi:hypothetical protein B0I35DRAFT_83645 [Stachybotrys elegans]|uniref:Uncharacterized protein n=1 Tax=Stachybotrys elegans TaxID=80388 RepID=A0A8K0SE53_9HYPO|nr:hypothetical protein B0I35DRAFT_83645 [Stachybotrys elegans]